MKYRARILWLARADLDRQAIYYDDRQEGLGERFLAAAERTIAGISDQPEASACYGFEDARLSGVRARPVSSFPRLLVFYRIEGSTVQILRILHSSRNVNDLTDEILPE